VESSCELGNEPLGSIKCWELPNGRTICGLLSGTQLHRVSYVNNNNNAKFSVFLCGKIQFKIQKNTYEVFK
jgi:hypothetical protein